MYHTNILFKKEGRERRRERERGRENKHSTSYTQQQHSGENSKQIRVTETRETYLEMFYLKGRTVVALTQKEHLQNESHSGIIHLSLSSSMIGKQAMEL